MGTATETELLAQRSALLSKGKLSRRDIINLNNVNRDLRSDYDYKYREAPKVHKDDNGQAVANAGQSFDYGISSKNPYSPNYRPTSPQNTEARAQESAALAAARGPQAGTSLTAGSTVRQNGYTYQYDSKGGFNTISRPAERQRYLDQTNAVNKRINAGERVTAGDLAYGSNQIDLTSDRVRAQSTAARQQDISRAQAAFRSREVEQTKYGNVVEQNGYAYLYDEKGGFDTIVRPEDRVRGNVQRAAIEGRNVRAGDLAVNNRIPLSGGAKEYYETQERYNNYLRAKNRVDSYEQRRSVGTDSRKYNNNAGSVPFTSSATQAVQAGSVSENQSFAKLYGKSLYESTIGSFLRGGKNFLNAFATAKETVGNSLGVITAVQRKDTDDAQYYASKQIVQNYENPDVRAKLFSADSANFALTVSTAPVAVTSTAAKVALAGGVAATTGLSTGLQLPSAIRQPTVGKAADLTATITAPLLAYYSVKKGGDLYSFAVGKKDVLKLGPLTYEKFVIPGDKESVIRVFGLEAGSKAQPIISRVNGRTQVGTPDVSPEILNIKPGTDVKIGSATQTKIFRTSLKKVQDNAPPAAVARRNEAIGVSKAIISETRGVKSKFINDVPLTTERLSKEGVAVFLKIAKEEKAVVFGSGARRLQIPNSVSKFVPRDIDIRLNDASPENLDRVIGRTLAQLKQKGINARRSADTPEAIEVKVGKTYIKAAEFKGEGLQESPEDAVPEFVLGFKKTGKPIKIGGQSYTALDEELRGVTQGVNRVTKTKEGFIDIYPPPKRQKDIGSVVISAETLKQSKFFNGKLSKNLDKFKQLFEYDENAPQDINVAIADFRGSPKSSGTVVRSLPSQPLTFRQLASQSPSPRSRSFLDISSVSPTSRSVTRSSSATLSPSFVVSTSASSASRSRSVSPRQSLRSLSVSAQQSPTRSFNNMMRSQSVSRSAVPRSTASSSSRSPFKRFSSMSETSFSPDDNFELKRSKKKLSVKINDKLSFEYAPSAYSTFFGVTGKVKKSQTFSGLELRPIATR